MTSGDFLSTAPVVLILALVALLAVASAVVLAPLERLARGRVVAFVVWLAGVWALAVLAIALLRRAI
jgi:hypothetical protein